MAKSENASVFFSGYACYENLQSSWLAGLDCAGCWMCVEQAKGVRQLIVLQMADQIDLSPKNPRPAA